MVGFKSVYIGWDPDPKEIAAFVVAKASARRSLGQYIPINGLILEDLQAKGLYTRPMEFRSSLVDKPIMWDVVSGAAQTTEHANSRFLVPYLAKSGWALFTDADVLFRKNIRSTFDNLNPKFAVYCVKHQYAPKQTTKMEGQTQTVYHRKNWSSVCFYNADHPSNKALTPELFNQVPGRDLHRFCWLEDDEIGELPPGYNFLVGHHDQAQIPDPEIVHFTEGTPNMPGYENCPFADEWRLELRKWAT